jgi:hypothetical protein
MSERVLTVRLSNGDTFEGTLAQVQAKQKEIISAVRGGQRDDLRKQANDAGQAAYDSYMSNFYAGVDKSGVIDASELADASAAAGALATQAKQAVYLAAGRVKCPNFDRCGGVRQAKFAVCARCDGKV